MIVLSVGMQKAGTAWFFNLTNDLLVAAGYDDIRNLRQRFHLSSLLTERNCNIGRPFPPKLVLLSIPNFLGKTYVIKTHESPTLFMRSMISSGIIHPTYIYRDPRDVAISLYEHGERIRVEGIRSSTGFDRIKTIDEAIQFTRELLDTWGDWMSIPGTYTVRYEDLREDTLLEVGRLATWLDISLPERELVKIISRYKPGQDHESRTAKQTHFHKGISGRWADVMSTKQKELSQQLFGPFLDRMGYAAED